jgi:hypothetical protein
VQIWTASVVIAIEPVPAQIGGSARGYQELALPPQTRRRPTRQATGPDVYASLVLSVNTRYCRIQRAHGKAKVLRSASQCLRYVAV